VGAVGEAVQQCSRPGVSQRLLDRNSSGAGKSLANGNGRVGASI